MVKRFFILVYTPYYDIFTNIKQTLDNSKKTEYNNIIFNVFIHNKLLCSYNRFRIKTTCNPKVSI